MNSRHQVGTLAGVLVTTGLLLSAQTYIYAPVIGGIVAAAASAHTPAQGARAGAFTGIAMLPVSVLLAVGIVGGPLENASGIAQLLESLRGIGPKTPLFYATFVYIIALYTAFTGAVFGTVTATVRTVLPVEPRKVETDHE
jgi:hypothetical protein